MLIQKKYPLVLIGASGFAEIAVEYFRQDSPYEVVACAVERDFITAPVLGGVPVIAFEDVDKLYPPQTHHAHVAITFLQLNRVRARLFSATKAKGYTMASYISSRAFVWPNVELGEHVFVFENNTIQPFVRIGDNVVIWSGNHIGHHSTIEDHCFLSSHVVISGGCSIGAHSFLGVNSSIAHGIKIAADNFIGMGANIAKNTEANSVYMPKDFAEKRDITAERYCKFSLTETGT
jgi:sugar O-acyltransferase (sialic acid O-acetyltransferase NeuD family)